MNAIDNKYVDWRTVTGSPGAKRLFGVRFLLTALTMIGLLHVISKETYAQDAYAAVWRPGNGAQWWRSGMSVDEFKAQDTTYFAQGLRIVTVEIEDGKYAAVWRPGSGAQWWRSGMCSDDFKTEDKVYFSEGLRLVDLDLHSNPRAIYRLPFAEGSGWKLTNGNWDDPTPGHGGSPNGLQAYAFDFVY